MTFAVDWALNNNYLSICAPHIDLISPGQVVHSVGTVAVPLLSSGRPIGQLDLISPGQNVLSLSV